MRKLAGQKCWTRWKGLWERVELLQLHGNVGQVRAFYEQLARQEPQRGRLVALRKRKHQSGLLPEESDMEILAQALTLRATDVALYFVSNDGDFTDFVSEIKNEFNVMVLPVQDLNRFREQLSSRALNYE